MAGSRHGNGKLPYKLLIEGFLVSKPGKPSREATTPVCVLTYPPDPLKVLSDQNMVSVTFWFQKQ